ncbi:endonuclease/exonuclease/phosphatase family protein [Tranquillimonas rosea]|uniref:endonuclease/exonuclease/phosphatase family protein n=1 Tax=Tranquillimonas rosea TaxID=641238 RepID=UPI003BAC05AD
MRAGDDPQVTTVAGVIAAAEPDILVLSGIDHDADLCTLSALAEAVAEAGHEMPHHFALASNAGLATGLDLDGDKRLGTPRDAQGYGRFAGAGGLAVLSRWPADRTGVVDFSTLLWSDLPGSDPPPWPDPAVERVQRLSSTAHWVVPVALPAGPRLHLLTFRATPPVFDGPEDRNGRRNHDEIALWLRYLDGALEAPPPDSPFVILGGANLDPRDGEGRRGALAALLADPRVQDTEPASQGGAVAALRDGGVNSGHRSPPRLDTVDWSDEGGPGNLRVDYVLPSVDLAVADSGVLWPKSGGLARLSARASRHRLVWVDVGY